MSSSVETHSVHPGDVTGCEPGHRIMAQNGMFRDVLLHGIPL
jgi:hypothetical protein